MSAYDYDKQQWITGEPARLLLLEHARADVALLESKDGFRFAQFINVNQVEYLAHRKADVAELSATN